MLFFFNVRIDPKEMSLEEMWDIWERETEAAIGAMEAGIVVAAYKVVGQRRVVGILNVESHDQMDQILMSALPMAHYLEFEQVLPVREYKDFAADVKRRWK